MNLSYEKIKITVFQFARLYQMKLGSKYDLLDTPRILFVKNIFSASNFMHIFNMSATYLQSVEKMAKLKTL